MRRRSRASVRPTQAVLRVVLSTTALGAGLLLGSGCREEAPAAPIASETYIQPDQPPTLVSMKNDAQHKLAFDDITASAGIEFTHVTGAFGKKWMPETMGGGAAFLDYDQDGRPDILLVNSTYWPDHVPPGAKPPVSRLFRNVSTAGKPAFEDVTIESGLAELSCYGMGTTIADYDGDGDTDVYITAVGKNHLLRNDDGRFVDVTDAAGVGYSRCEGEASPWEWSTGAVWVDYDRDGDLDLFVANYVQWTPETDIWTTMDGKTKSYATPQQYHGATSVLFANQGDGTFADVTKQAGVYNPKGKSLSVITDDFNDDGWPDLFITNDTQPNFYYVNATDGTYNERALSAGVAYDESGQARAGMGTSVADVTNSGHRAIAIGNFAGEPLSLYSQVHVDTFIDKAGATRISKPTTAMLTFGVLFADFNLDGFDDLILANGHIEPAIANIREGWSFAQPLQVFLNNRQGRFVDVTRDLGPAIEEPMVGRCVASADIDGDGDLDVLATSSGGSPRLLQNNTQRGAGIVRVRLIGKAPNREAIGSRLRAHVGDMVQTRFVTTGGSYLSQSELTATFGLGPAEAIDKLEIRWPDGTSRELGPLAAKPDGVARYTIRQDEGTAGKQPG